MHHIYYLKIMTLCKYKLTETDILIEKESGDLVKPQGAMPW